MATVCTIINGVIDLLICASICNTMHNNSQVRIITTGPVVEFKFIGDTDFSVSSGDSEIDDFDPELSANEISSINWNDGSFERRFEYATEQNNIE